MKLNPTQHDTPETITFQKRSYLVIQECPVPALLAVDGLLRQFIVQGQRGATVFMQLWQAENCRVMRSISTTGRTKEEAF